MSIRDTRDKRTSKISIKRREEIKRPDELQYKNSKPFFVSFVVRVFEFRAILLFSRLPSTGDDEDIRLNMDNLMKKGVMR